MLLDELKSEVLTPPVCMYDGSADSAPAALTVDTTARTQVSKDPFLIDWAGVTDISFSMLGQSNHQSYNDEIQAAQWETDTNQQLLQWQCLWPIQMTQTCKDLNQAGK